jgi:hypothetical protein
MASNVIGGVFCLEETQKRAPVPPAAPSGPAQTKPGFLESLGGEDLRLCMSGRCAIYYCLLDLMERDKKRVAYLPAYTCETVIAPYKKAGYELRFYDISPEGLTPQFDRRVINEISVMGLCGYYGFSNYERAFVKECAEAGVAIIHDITHSAFSADGIDTNAAYTAGSFRKWMGIPSGGIAIKRKGRFDRNLLPPEEEHIRGRLSIFEEQKRFLEKSPGASEEKVNDVFWSTEMRLREIFDAYRSDELSEQIMTRFSYAGMINRRRENYAFILEQNPFGPRLKPVFPVLGEGVCPSHISVYADDREKARELFTAKGIKTTIYWPFHEEFEPRAFPGAQYIYNHIFSVPMDQRYGWEDMEYLCEVLKKAGN